LLEFDTECTELNQNGSWKYISDCSYFYNQYIQLLVYYRGLQGNPDAAGIPTKTPAPNNVQKAVKSEFQKIYKKIPTDFKDIKRHISGQSYDWSIRSIE
jgi:hypothetical protein